jgi:hypothetical protein
MRDAWIKHNRALTHIQELNTACAEFVGADPKPYNIAVEFEAESGCYVARFLELRAPDLQLGAIVGDIAHNLRSALDLSAWQLAIQHTRKAAKENRGLVSFPLTRSNKRFRAHDAVPFFSERALAVIEGLQPYDSPDRKNLEALSWLSTLSNADNHRVATGSFADPDLSGVTYHVEDGQIRSVEDLTEPGTAIEPGAPIAHVAVDGPKVRVKGEPTPKVIFTSGSAQFGLTAIMEMFSIVEYALTELGGAFS